MEKCLHTEYIPQNHKGGFWERMSKKLSDPEEAYEKYCFKKEERNLGNVMSYDMVLFLKEHISKDRMRLLYYLKDDKCKFDDYIKRFSKPEEIRLGNVDFIKEVVVDPNEKDKDLSWNERALQRQNYFDVGQNSFNAQFLAQDVIELRHLYILGDAKMGKTNVLRRISMELLEQSTAYHHVIFECKEPGWYDAYHKVPMVSIVKEQQNMLSYLKIITQEIKRRQLFLKKNSFDAVDAFRDKLDRIVLYIDNAEALYETDDKSETDKALLKEMQGNIDFINKHGNLCGVYMMISSEKLIPPFYNCASNYPYEGRLCLKTDKEVSRLFVREAHDFKFDGGFNKKAKGCGLWSKKGKVVPVFLFWHRHDDFQLWSRHLQNKADVNHRYCFSYELFKDAPKEQINFEICYDKSKFKLGKS